MNQAVATASLQVCRRRTTSFLTSSFSVLCSLSARVSIPMRERSSQTWERYSPPFPRLLACRYPLHLPAEKHNISTHTPWIILHVITASISGPLSALAVLTHPQRDHLGRPGQLSP
nr:unnamed protein product [Digitaria exilis]